MGDRPSKVSTPCTLVSIRRGDKKTQDVQRRCPERRKEVMGMTWLQTKRHQATNGTWMGCVPVNTESVDFQPEEP